MHCPCVPERSEDPDLCAKHTAGRCSKDRVAQARTKRQLTSPLLRIVGTAAASCVCCDGWAKQQQSWPVECIESTGQAAWPLRKSCCTPLAVARELWQVWPVMPQFPSTRMDLHCRKSWMEPWIRRDAAEGGRHAEPSLMNSTILVPAFATGSYAGRLSNDGSDSALPVEESRR